MLRLRIKVLSKQMPGCPFPKNHDGTSGLWLKVAVCLCGLPHTLCSAEGPRLTSSRPSAGRWHLSSSSSASSLRALLCCTSRFLLSRSLCRVARSSSSRRLSCSCSSRARNPRYFSNSKRKRCLCISTFSWSDTGDPIINQGELQVWGREADCNVQKDPSTKTLSTVQLRFNNMQKPEAALWDQWSSDLEFEKGSWIWVLIWPWTCRQGSSACKFLYHI